MDISYHAIESKTRGLNACDRQSNEHPLVLNCAGRIERDHPFITDNQKGRSDFYLMYVCEGELNAFGEICGAGSVIIIPPKTPYKYSFDGEKLSYLWAHFTGSYAKELIGVLGAGDGVFVKKTGESISVPRFFGKMFDVFMRSGTLMTYELSSVLESLIVAIAVNAAKEKENSRSLARSLSYIHENYDKDIAIPELAKMENLSNSRYVAIFTQCMGMPPVRYILELRLRYACQLLESTDMSIKEISALSGYNDPHFFSKQFKKHIGVSPRDYRA